MEPNYKILRTDSTHSDFILLTNQLDKELAIVDGEDHTFYSTFNKINEIKNCVLLYKENSPIACGGIKPHEDSGAEIKRMFVVKNERGKGAATKVLNELEKWALELGFKSCILETGATLPAAISLYKKSGYLRVDNYGQYVGIDNSICFEKTLIHE